MHYTTVAFVALFPLLALADPDNTGITRAIPISNDVDPGFSFDPNFDQKWHSVPPFMGLGQRITVQDITALNPQIMNPNMIYPNQIIKLPSDISYIVAPGDSLWQISKSLVHSDFVGSPVNPPISVNELIALNPQIQNPNAIYPYQKIKLPPNTGYIVQPGDSLYRIARRFAKCN